MDAIELSIIRADAGRKGGLVGGRSRSPAKRLASVLNGLKGGRPRKKKRTA